MDKIFLQNLLSDLKVRIYVYQKQLELVLIERTLFIVEVFALTVPTDLVGAVSTQNAYCPTQFTKEAVNIILTMTFRDGFGEKTYPRGYSRVNWHSEKLTKLNETFNRTNSI